MAEPNEQAKSGENATPADRHADLPHVESPPLSLADEIKSELHREKFAVSEPIEPMRAPFAAAPDLRIEPDGQPDYFARSKIEMPHVKMPRISFPSFSLSPRIRRAASLAATVMIAAGLGAAFASVVNKKPTPVPVQRDAALVDENAAMQKSIARLSKDLASLKATVETANRDSSNRIARLSDKLERMPDVTGSIARQAAAVPVPPLAPQQVATAPIMAPPLPQARPAMPAVSDRRPVVPGWTIHEIRGGTAWVENGGELFAAQPGVPLPGLGTVEAIRRDGHRWIVVTSRGIISSAGENTATNVRPKPFYPPYYRR